MENLFRKMEAFVNKLEDEAFISKVKEKLRSGGPHVCWLILGGIAIFWVLAGVYIVDEGEMAVERRFGKMRAVTGPGPHYYIPWPMERVDVIQVEQIRSMELGFRTADPGPPVQIQPFEVESLMITGDENLVNVMVAVQYRISDPVAYLFSVWDPEGGPDSRTLRDATETVLRGVIGSMNIDDILTVGRARIQDETKVKLQELMDLYETGLFITTVKLQAVSPPQPVWRSFKDVVSAKEDRLRIINEAQAYSEDLLPKARGEAEQIIRAAEAYKETRIRGAQGDADRFVSMLKEYRQAKDVTRRRLYLETMHEMLSKVKKVIVSEEVASKALPFLPLGEMDASNSLSETRKGDNQ